MMLAEKVARTYNPVVRGDVWPRVFGSPEFSPPSEREAAARAKERAIVFVKIGVRPGDNTDMLEALGLIPAAVKS